MNALPGLCPQTRGPSLHVPGRDSILIFRNLVSAAHTMIRIHKQFKRLGTSLVLSELNSLLACGVFLPGDDQNFIALNLAEDEPWRAVAHDFAHLLLNYNYPLTQGWFDEGFAEYFSSIRVGDKQVEIGGDPELGVPSKDIPANQMGAANQPKPRTELLHAPDRHSITDLLAPQ